MLGILKRNKEEKTAKKIPTKAWLPLGACLCDGGRAEVEKHPKIQKKKEITS